jgi:hypothetical protein
MPPSTASPPIPAAFVVGRQDFLKIAAPAADRLRRQDGKEESRMGRKTTGQEPGGLSGMHGGSPGSQETVKVTLHLTVGTAQRLGVESAMRRISQSAIAEEVLAAYLSRWRLPDVPDSGAVAAG